MSALLTSPIRALMFSYEFHQLDIATESPVVKFTLADSSGVAVIEDSYYADKSGAVHLYDLDKVVDSMLGDAPVGDVVLKLDGREVARVRVIRCTVATDLTAEEFVDTHFLTTPEETRITAAGRYELLTLYPRTPCVVSAAFEYLETDGTVKTYHAILKGITTAEINTVVMVDVSPSRISSSANLLSYELTAGGRSRRYILDRRGLEADPAIVYRNRFFVWETFYFTGTKKTDPQYDRQAAWINGQFLNYRITEVMQYKAMTGAVTAEEVAQLEDIVRSPDVRLLTPDGQFSDKITVVDADIAADNQDFSLMRLTVTYRRADRISAKSFDFPKTKIFDLTHDGSFE